MTLQERAKAFLGLAAPKDVGYVADSIAERVIRECAAEGRVEVDAEMAELLEICVMETRAAGGSGSAARRAYFRESAEILEAILEGSGGGG